MRDPKERLRHILDAIAAIERYLSRGRTAFEQDELLQGWFVRHLQIIGEAVRGLPEDVRAMAPEEGPIAHGDTFHDDRFPDLKADYILANLPFNMKSWGGAHLREDKRWQFGVPPVGNANFAWVQHMIHPLAPTGLAGFVLANGSMSSNQSGKGEIRPAAGDGRLAYA